MEPTHHTYQPAGKVAHSAGVVNGLIDNGCRCCLFTDVGYDRFSDLYQESPLLEVYKKNRNFFKLNSVIHIAHRLITDEVDFLLLRKAGAASFFLLPIICLTVLMLRTIGATKAKVVCEVNGIYFDYKAGFVSNFVAVGLVANKLSLYFADYLYVVNEDLGRKFTKGFLKRSVNKVLIVNNGGPKAAPITFSKSGIVHLLYFGVLKDYYDIPAMCRLAEYISENSVPNLIIHVVGFGELEDNIIECSSKNKSMRFYGRKTRYEFSELVCSLQGKVFGLVPLAVGNGSGQMTPIKAFEYMSFGIPLITSASCLKGYAHDNFNALVYQHSDGLRSAAIRAISMTFVDYQLLQKNVIDEYKNHTWSERMTELVSGLNRS